MALVLKNLGSLITYEHGDHEHCLGYLMDFKDKGVFDAEHGKVNVSPEHAEIHNKLLDEAMLQGLDESCQVGQGGTFYTGKPDKMGRPTEIRTFMGTLVSSDLTVKQIKNRHVVFNVTFRRNGKVFRGRTSHEHDLFNFRRIA
jgi:hypothetical protein